MIHSVYFLVITSRYCKHEIRINDLYCFNNHTGNQSGSEVPINDLLIKGNNTLNIRIEPNNIEKTEYDIVFKLKAVIEERNIEDNSKLNELLIIESEVPIEKIPKKLDGQFTIKEDFIEHKYSKYPIINLNSETFLKVHEFYRHIAQLMISKDINTLIDLFQNKETEYANAYNLLPHKRLEFVKKSLMQYVSEPKSEVLGLDIKYLNFEVYALGKLICLEEKKTKRAALGIYSEINKLTSYFPIYFGLNDKDIVILK